MSVSDEVNRREFCAHAVQLISVLAVGSLTPGCASPTSPSPSPSALPVLAATVVDGALVLEIAADSPLATVGGAVRVEARVGNFERQLLIARISADAFTAVTATCTHEGCTIGDFTDQIYTCHCHGSRFTTTGSVANGPASSPLRQFSTDFADEVLTVRI